MAFFWGVEIRAGKPYVHEFDEERGPLHISQATLGNYSAKSTTKRIIVQCNVGDKAPIYLCSLFPEKNETCQLNLEFAEEDEVTFSVIGPLSVHLSGFFTGPMQGICEHKEDKDYDDFDSDEEDISETESDDDDSSEYDTDADMDEFFDHNMFHASTVPNSGVRIEEIIDTEKSAIGNGLSQKPKKKKSKQSGYDDNVNSERQIVVKSSASAAVVESEDKDGFPILSSQDQMKNNFSNAIKKAEDKGIDEGAERQKGKDNSLKRKMHGDDDQLSDAETNDKQARKNKKKKVKEKEEKVTRSGAGSKSVVDAVEVTTIIHTDQAIGVSEGEPNIEKGKKKKNKKKKKMQASAADTNLKHNISDKNGFAMEIEGKAEAKPFRERSFDNGLVIEELEMGKPNGKRASRGKKVSVHYIGKLKNNGKIFDSNIGKAPFKFRLGIGQVIKGWDVGVEGMRVGDKRRLTIPPSMGYGAKGAGRDIPPNAWLIFDVELVDVN